MSAILTNFINDIVGEVLDKSADKRITSRLLGKALQKKTWNDNNVLLVLKQEFGSLRTYLANQRKIYNLHYPEDISPDFIIEQKSENDIDEGEENEEEEEEENEDVEEEVERGGKGEDGKGNTSKKMSGRDGSVDDNDDSEEEEVNDDDIDEDESENGVLNNESRVDSKGRDMSDKTDQKYSSENSNFDLKSVSASKILIDGKEDSYNREKEIVENWESYSMTDLKEVLKTRGLKVSGKKSDLTSRLRDDDSTKIEETDLKSPPVKKAPGYTPKNPPKAWQRISSSELSSAQTSDEWTLGIIEKYLIGSESESVRLFDTHRAFFFIFILCDFFIFIVIVTIPCNSSHSVLYQ